MRNILIILILFSTFSFSIILSEETRTEVCEFTLGSGGVNDCVVYSDSTTREGCIETKLVNLGGSSRWLRTDNKGTNTNWDDTSYYKDEYTYKTTVSCICDAEVIHPTPDPLVYEMVLDDSRGILSMKSGVGCKTSQSELIKQSEDFRMCREDYHGTMKVISEKDCCKMSGCFAHIENNSTQPDENKTSPCDDNETYIDSIERCHPNDCPIKYECIEADLGYDDKWTNYFDILDCNGKNLGKAQTEGDEKDCFTEPNSNGLCPAGYYLEDITTTVDGKDTINQECAPLEEDDGTSNDDNNSESAESSDSNSTEPTLDTNNTEPIPKEDCDFPFPDYLGYPFQRVATSRDRCIRLHMSQGDGSGQIFDCPDDSVACYYNTSSNNDNNSSNNDNNNSNDDPKQSGSGNTNDNNTSTVGDQGDTNSSDVLNTSNLEDKLSSIKESINENASNNRKDLTNINDTLNTNGNTSHSDLKKINDTLDTKLDDIKDALNPDLEVDTSELEKSLSKTKTMFNNTLTSFDYTYEYMLSLFNHTSSPRVTANGTCLLHISTMHIGSTNIDFSKLSVLRPGIQFFLNLYLFYLTIKLYTAIARDLTKYFIGA